MIAAREALGACLRLVTARVVVKRVRDWQQARER